MIDRQRSILLRLLPRTLGELPDAVKTRIEQLSADRLETLSLETLNEEFVELTPLDNLTHWLDQDFNQN